MRTLVVHTKLRPETEASVREHMPNPSFVRGDRTTGYYWAAKVAWEACADDDEDLALVEHDIEVRPDVPVAFAGCAGDWCLFPYPLHRTAEGQLYIFKAGFGCVRFRAALIKARRAVFTEIGPQDWRHLDTDVRLALRPLVPHVHWPALAHLRVQSGASRRFYLPH